MNHITNFNQIAIQSPQGDAVTMSSREIAELTDKRHAHVLRDIEKMIQDIDEPKFGLVDFEAKYQDTKGEWRKEYRLPKDLTITLVTGYRADLRYKVVKKLEELEGREAPFSNFNIPTTFSEALRLAANQSELIEKQDATIAVMKPKTDFYDAFMNSDGLYTLQNAGRVKNLRPNLFIRWLKAKYLFYQGRDLVPYVQYRQLGVFEVKSERGNDGRAHLQTYITPKGLEYFSTRVPDNIRINAIKTGEAA